MRCSARKTLVVVTLALASCRGPMQAPTPTPEIISLNMGSSNSTQPLLRELARSYTRDNTRVTFVDNPTHQPRYILTTHLPPGDDIWAAPLGTDGIAIVTHPGNNPPPLTANDLRSIFTGTADNWSAVGGRDLDISVISRESSSPTRQALSDQVLGQRPITFRARLATTPAAMLDLVAQTPGAIGFISMALVTEAVRVIPLVPGSGATAVLPTTSTVADSSYPLRTPLLVVGPQAPVPGDGYYEFILWIQESAGQSIVGQFYGQLP